MIAGPILAIKVTPKAYDAIHDLRMSPTDDTEPTKLEIAKEVLPLYAPAILVVVSGVVCIIGLNNVHMRRTAALASLYSVAETSLKEYQAKVVEQIGINKEEKVRAAIAQDHADSNPPQKDEILIANRGNTLCCEGLNGRYFRSDMETIRSTINDLNRDIISDTFARVDDWYYALGLPGTKLGNMMGWDDGCGPVEVAFSSILVDGEPCLMVDFRTLPRMLW